MTDDQAQPRKEPARPPPGLAMWMWRFVQRVGMLKTPGVYHIDLVVRSDGVRELIIYNADRPHRLENLGT